MIDKRTYGQTDRYKSSRLKENLLEESPKEIRRYQEKERATRLLKKLA